MLKKKEVPTKEKREGIFTPSLDSVVFLSPMTHLIQEIIEDEN